MATLDIPNISAGTHDNSMQNAIAAGAGACSTARRRSVVVAALFAIGVALGMRLIQLQVIESRSLAERANRQRSYVDSLPALPGDLMDRNGRVLAITVKARSLFVVPQSISNPATIASRLAGAVHLESERLCERILEQRGKKFLWIKRRLDAEEEEAVRRLNLPSDVWGFREEAVRRYPQGALAAHVLGLRDIDGSGRGGLEQMLDVVLRGQNGHRTLIRDARGRAIDVADEHDLPPQRGADVTTTLDSILQLYAERELDRLIGEWKPHGACAIVADPKTCEILAMASRPTFDPNHPEEAIEEAWKNRAVAWMYEPGSTFKPFIVAGALERGVLQRHEEIDCGGGEAHFGGRLLHDTHSYGLLGVTDVLVKSSNIGMARIGARLANDELHATIVGFGFGRPTGSGLPGEMSGKLHPLRNWTSYSNTSLSIGQELAVTPLQMICAHAALANGGTLNSPKLVLDGAPTAGGLAVTSVVSKATDHNAARWLVEEPMRQVVERGTGKRARLDGYAVFGKTGTAQKLDPETGTYSATKYVSSFVCGAPAGAPRVLVIVVVDEPSTGNSHYGGTVAAPTAAAILRQTLNHLRIPRDGQRSDDASTVEGMRTDGSDGAEEITTEGQ